MEEEVGNDFTDVQTQRLSCRTLQVEHQKEVTKTCSSACSCGCTFFDPHFDLAASDSGYFCFKDDEFSSESQYFGHRQQTLEVIRNLRTL